MTRLFILLAALAALLAPGVAQGKLVAGAMVLHGAAKTRESTIRTIVGLAPGGTVDFAVLDSAEERLAQSDLFVSAHVWLDLPREEASRKMYLEESTEVVDVHVTVEEKQSWFAVPMGSVGAGDMAIGAAFADQNLAGLGTQMLAAGQYGQSKSYALAGMRQPRMAFAPLTWSAAAVWRMEDFRFYEDHRLVLHVPTRVWGGEAQVGWVITPTLRLMGGVLYNRTEVFRPVSDDPAAAAPAYNARSGNLVVAQLLLFYDSTVAPQGLRRGTRFSVRNELSDGFWGSDFDYLKLDFELELYGQWWKTYPSLALRFLANHPTSQRGVPLTQLLRAGGPELRGFNTWEFHGDTVLTLQLEDQVPVLTGVKIPLTRTSINLAAAVFADAGVILERNAGGVPASGQERTGKAALHAGVGVGVRVVIPGIAIPALKADLAYGLDVHDFAFTLSIAGGSLN